MALTQCVDCGKGLSPTATDCNNCNSKDPFGVRRGEQKAQITLVLLLLGMIALTYLAHHFGVLVI